MTPDEAAWVREHVFTRTHREIEAAYPSGWYTLCACEYGICGACNGDSDPAGRSRHDRCLSRQHGHPIVVPLAHLTDKRCRVLGIELWPATGSSCRYICPCPCPKTGNAPATPSRRRPAAVKHMAAPASETASMTSPVRSEGALFDLEAL